MIKPKLLKRSLSHFLSDTDSFTLFAGYLSECFALENLLFLERATILFHIILKYQRIDEKLSIINQRMNLNNTFDARCYDLKYDFLSQIYNDIELLIIAESANNDNMSDSMTYKRGILQAMKMIYVQFFNRGSDTE